jgi:ferredoxin
LDNATACLFITQESKKTETLNKKYSRVDISETIKNIDTNNVQIFLCGTQKFNSAMNKSLIEKGIHDSDIHEDIFFSPTTSSESTNKNASLTTSIPITFIHASGEESTITWHPQHGTLLNTAEKNDIPITANCRSGACRACLYAIEGEVENLSSPASPAPKNWAYLCCAAPLSPITIREGSPP